LKEWWPSKKKKKKTNMITHDPRDGVGPLPSKRERERKRRSQREKKKKEQRKLFGICRAGPKSAFSNEESRYFLSSGGIKPPWGKGKTKASKKRGKHKKKEKPSLKDKRKEARKANRVDTVHSISRTGGLQDHRT